MSFVHLILHRYHSFTVEFKVPCEHQAIPCRLTSFSILKLGYLLGVVFRDKKSLIPFIIGLLSHLLVRVFNRLFPVLHSMDLIWNKFLVESGYIDIFFVFRVDTFERLEGNIELLPALSFKLLRLSNTYSSSACPSYSSYPLSFVCYLFSRILIVSFRLSISFSSFDQYFFSWFIFAQFCHPAIVL